MIILVIHQIRPRIGLTWLAAILVGVINWGVLIFFRFFPPEPLIISQWMPFVGTSGSLIFQLDSISWVYTFSLASLLLAVLFTAAARLQHHSNPRSWAASMAIAGVGSLATMSATPLTFVLTWMVIDLSELTAIIAGVPDAHMKKQAVIGFASRLAGSLFLLLAMFISSALGSTLVLIAPLPEVGLLLVIAVGLRLGVLPIHLPYAQDLPMRRGLGTILRMTAPVSCLVLLARLPNTFLPAESANLLLALTGLTTVYCAGMWVFSDHEIKARPYWLIALAGMALACVIRGYPTASIAWGMTVVLSGGLIFLYSIRSKWSIVFPIAGLILLSGLPFTPAAIGWMGLVTTPINIADLLFIFTNFLLLIGYLRHSLRVDETGEGNERWVKMAYPTGLIFLITSALFIMLMDVNSLVLSEVWWASLISFLFAILGFFFVNRAIHKSSLRMEERWFYIIGRRVVRGFSNFLSFRWLYIAIGWLLRQVSWLVDTFSTILEGDGGILWVLVLLALFISISLIGVVP